MGTLPEVSTFTDTVYELETTDPVQGGPGGIANEPASDLTNRTRWLFDQWEGLLNGTIRPGWIAPLNGAQFTGSDTVPNVAAGDNSTLIANTDFVQTAKAGVSTVPVGGNSNVTLTQPQWGVGIIIFTGVLTGNISVLFPKNVTGAWIIFNSTTGSFTLSCQVTGGSGVQISQSQPDETIWSDGTTIRFQVTPFVIGGTGVAPGNYPFADVTVDADGRISNITSGNLGNVPVTSWDGRTGAVVMGQLDVVNALGYLPLGSVNGIAPEVGVSIDVEIVHGSVSFSSSSQFTAPAGVFSVLAELWGGGGGSGGTYLTNSCSGGGAGGGYTRGRVNVTPGQAYTVTVGLGGSAGQVNISQPTNGGAGGTSSFQGLSATGGQGGIAAINGPADTSGFAQPGTGSGGSFTVQGGKPFTGFIAKNDQIGEFAFQAAGGGSFGTPMAHAGAASVSSGGIPGVFPGGGASGSVEQANGAAGAQGCVALSW